MSDPVAPVDTYPVWVREPAKMIGWVLTAVLAICAGIVELANEFTGILPEAWQDEVRAVLVVVGVVTLIATRIQALLTRARVWSPATLDANAARRAGHVGQGIGTPEAGESLITVVVVCVFVVIVVMLLLGRI